MTMAQYGGAGSTGPLYEEIGWIDFSQYSHIGTDTETFVNELPGGISVKIRLSIPSSSANNSGFNTKDQIDDVPFTDGYKNLGGATVLEQNAASGTPETLIISIDEVKKIDTGDLLDYTVFVADAQQTKAEDDNDPTKQEYWDFTISSISGWSNLNTGGTTTTSTPFASALLPHASNNPIASIITNKEYKITGKVASNQVGAFIFASNILVSDGIVTITATAKTVSSMPNTDKSKKQAMALGIRIKNAPVSKSTLGCGPQVNLGGENATIYVCKTGMQCFNFTSCGCCRGEDITIEYTGTVYEVDGNGVIKVPGFGEFFMNSSGVCFMPYDSLSSNNNTAALDFTVTSKSSCCDSQSNPLHVTFYYDPCRCRNQCNCHRSCHR